MLEVTYVYNKLEDCESMKNLTDKGDYCINFIDSGSAKEKSKAFKFKSEWGAREEPFALITENNKAIIAFYTEDGNINNKLKDFLDSYFKYENTCRAKEET